MDYTKYKTLKIDSKLLFRTKLHLVQYICYTIDLYRDKL